MNQGRLNKLGKTAFMLTAAAFVASAALSILTYWDANTVSSDTVVCLCMMGLTAALLLVMTWDMTRYEKASNRSGGGPFLVVRSGSKHASTSEGVPEEVSPKGKKPR